MEDTHRRRAGAGRQHVGPPRHSRRTFLSGTAATAGLLITHGAARTYAANEKLNIALVGVGGRGSWFVGAVPDMQQNLVAFCDVDASRAAEGFRRFPDVPQYHDFRRMLEKMNDAIDAVIVATPDHTHAVASAAALHAGKPVYCEKPLTYDIHEARTLGRLAAETNLPTQMGNQGTASPAFRRAVELVQAGVIGPVRKVYAWNTGADGQAERPDEKPDIPDYVQWDQWLGPAPYRPYHARYLRGRWHSWLDFGTGTLGNWACHTLNLPFKALRFGDLWQQEEARIEVAADHPPHNGETYPRSLKLDYRIPARGDLPAVEVQWANGTGPELEQMGVRKAIEELLDHRLDWGDAGDEQWHHWAGVLLVGEKGMIHANAHNTEFKLLPEDRFADADLPEPTLERVPGHEREWMRAIRGGQAPMSNFTDLGGPLTELVALGNVAMRAGESVKYVPTTGRLVNNAAAERYLQRDYREGWSL